MSEPFVIVLSKRLVHWMLPKLISGNWLKASRKKFVEVKEEGAAKSFEFPSKPKTAG